MKVRTNFILLTRCLWSKN